MILEVPYVIYFKGSLFLFFFARIRFRITKIRIIVEINKNIAADII